MNVQERQAVDDCQKELTSSIEQDDFQKFLFAKNAFPRDVCPIAARFGPTTESLQAVGFLSRLKETNDGFQLLQEYLERNRQTDLLGLLNTTKGNAHAVDESLRTTELNATDEDESIYEQISLTGGENPYYVSLSADLDKVGYRKPPSSVLPQLPLSLEDEAHRIRKQRRSRRLKRAICILADVQLAIGIVSVLHGVVNAFYLQQIWFESAIKDSNLSSTASELAPPHLTYSGIWGGAYMLFSGVLGIVAIRRRTKTPMYAFVASSIIGVVVFVPAMLYIQITELFWIMFQRCHNIILFSACGTQFKVLAVLPPMSSLLFLIVSILSATFACYAAKRAAPSRIRSP